MEVTSQIPNELVSSVTSADDPSRRASEPFAREELRAGRISEVRLCGMFGLAPIQVDGFRLTARSKSIPPKTVNVERSENRDSKTHAAGNRPTPARSIT
jgi:hypothetical protein